MQHALSGYYQIRDSAEGDEMTPENLLVVQSALFLDQWEDHDDRLRNYLKGGRRWVRRKFARRTMDRNAGKYIYEQSHTSHHGSDGG